MSEEKPIEKSQKFEGFVKEIKSIFKRGKSVLRGGQKYTYVNTGTINCFGHAFLNFSNKYIEGLSDKYRDEMFNFLWVFKEIKESQSKDKSATIYCELENEIKERVKSIGLQIEECDINDKMNKGEWKVAFYYNFMVYPEDFHFMRQEKNGVWTSKSGNYINVEKFKNLPIVYGDGYQLIKIFKVTNPYLTKAYSEEENKDNDGEENE